MLRWFSRNRSGDDQCPVDSRRPISIGPHNLRLYEYLLRRFIGRNAEFITAEGLFSPEGLSAETAYVTLRHDLDYRPDALEAIIDLERRYGLKSEVHVIVDGEFYDPVPLASYWRRLAGDGFEIGLHTQAPPRDDFEAYFCREVDVFSDLLGHQPRTFSIHGAVPRPSDWAVRVSRFRDWLAPRMGGFGLLGSHNFGGVNLWIEDSRIGGEFAYLHTDWIETVPEPGKVIGVLVHPEHWHFAPALWDWDMAEISEPAELVAFISEARAARSTG